MTGFVVQVCVCACVRMCTRVCVCLTLKHVQKYDIEKQCSTLSWYNTVGKSYWETRYSNPFSLFPNADWNDSEHTDFHMQISSYS